MHLKTFDKLAGLILAFVWGFAAGVAVATWDWFPIRGTWGRIAQIPANGLNYFALLTPWILLLAYLLLRRFCYKHLL